jgi:hypothetical protein
MRLDLPVVLNELSYEEWRPDLREAAQVVREFAVALVEIRRLRACFLLAEEPIANLRFGDVWLQQLTSDASIRDELRAVFAMANRSPYESLEGLGELAGIEGRVGDLSSMGLLVAHLMKSVALSFASSEHWNRPLLELTTLEMDDDANVHEEKLDVPHVANAAHVAVHQGLISQFGFDRIKSGAQLWDARAELFPHVTFLAKVEEHLNGIGEGFAFAQVYDRLLSLEAAISDWNSSGSSAPVWKSKVTPESETRRKLCEFVDDAGVSHCYEMHARYTPGAGRIHFRVIDGRRLIEVAYVGEKL